MDGKYKEDKFINIQNLYGTQLLSCLSTNIAKKAAGKKRKKEGEEGRDAEKAGRRGRPVKGRDKGVA